MDWIKNIFDVYTRAIAGDDWRFLILDGYHSHVPMSLWNRYCEADQIALYCLPLHSTHILQPLAVGFFGLLQHCYGKVVDDSVRREYTAFIKEYTVFIKETFFLYILKHEEGHIKPW